MIFSSRVFKNVKYGIEAISFLAPKVWALVPEKMKECPCLEAFKSKIRKWKLDCPCRLHKTYWQHVGLINVSGAPSPTLSFWKCIKEGFFEVTIESSPE